MITISWIDIGPGGIYHDEALEELKENTEIILSDFEKIGFWRKGQPNFGKRVGYIWGDWKGEVE